MGEPSQTSTATTEKKRGPKPVADQVKALQTEVDNLKACISKMAHMTGQQRVLDEFGIDRWEVTAASMKKGGK